MAPLKFYADLRSQPCRAVYLFMKCCNIPFELVKVDLFTGEQLQETFTKIHSVQRVPVIDDNGFILGESGAIFRYLSRKYSVPDHWYPKDLQEQSKIDEYLNWHHSSIRQPCMMTFRHEFINTVRGRPVKEEERQVYQLQLLNSLRHLDEFYLKDTPFLNRNDISVADFQCLSELMQLEAINDESMYMSNPKLGAWSKRVKEAAGPHLQVCMDEGVNMMKSVYDTMKKSKL
ncbi:Glutathione S-transferase theta-1 [Mactra antiquata]